MFVPYPIIEFGRMYLPFIGQTEKKTRGIFIYPSLNIIGERKPSDDNSLEGTKKIDWAFEAGIGGGFRYDWFRAYATIRQGFNGYSGQTGEIGADVILPIGRALRGRLRAADELGLGRLHGDLFRRHAEGSLQGHPHRLQGRRRVQDGWPGRPGQLLGRRQDPAPGQGLLEPADRRRGRQPDRQVRQPPTSGWSASASAANSRSTCSASLISSRRAGRRRRRGRARCSRGR